MSKPGDTGKRISRWQVALALLTATLALLTTIALHPTTSADAAGCTDTWIGPDGFQGDWRWTNEWSAGRVPTKSDVVCIGAGKTVYVDAEGATADSVHGEGELQVAGGTLQLQSASDIRAFFIGSGTLTDPATLTTRSLRMFGGGRFVGGGTLVLAAGGSGAAPSERSVLSSTTFVNEGTFSIPDGNRFGEENGSRFVNRGIVIFNDEYENGIIEVGSGAPSSVINLGTIEKTEGTGVGEIQPATSNYGRIIARTGRILIKKPVGALASAATPGHACVVDPVDCATGNFTESQTDLAIGGRGVGLNLSRSYSAQAAASGAAGIFGHGWTNSFGARLAIEEAGAKVTLTEASGTTVPFTRSGSSYLAPGWSRDRLTGSAEAGFTLTLPDQTKEKFTGAGKLESVTDRNANATKLTYAASGKLEKITDPTGRSITLTYNAQGLVEKATDPMAHVVRYAYESGNLKTVTLPGDAAPRWTFGYDASNRMTSIVGGRGGRTTNEYDGSNRVISQTDPGERTTTWTYEGFHTRFTNKSTGAVTDEWFNSFNQPLSITHGYGTAQAATESFTYTEAGLLASKTDGNGHTTTYSYDAEGNRTSERDAEGDETKWTFDGAHQILTETTPRGEKTTIERDAAGNPKTISRPAPESKTQTVSYVRGVHGEVESMSDPLANKWTYGYDSYGDRNSETDPLGDKRTWTYDADSRITSTVAPRGNESGAEAAKFTTSTERDGQGRTIKVTDPLGGATKFTYDADGDLESITDPKTRKTKFVYDADDERIKVERPDGSVQETAYDGAGQVSSQTDGRKYKTTYVRNVLEQPVEIIDPLERKTTQTFDAAGNLKTKVDPEGRTTTYVYDKADRPKEVTYSAEPSKKVTYGYDADSDLTKMVDASGESTYEYDQLDRLTHSRNGHGETLGWAYNLAEEPTGLTYPNGKAIVRSYDKAGRLESITDWLAHKTSFAYNRDSESTVTTFPTTTGDIDEFAYDRADRMSGVTMKKGTATLASLAYVRDVAGLLESLTSKGLPGAESESFGYDLDERLTRAGSSIYEYDTADNPTKAPGTVNVFDKAAELESATGSTFSYDKEGDRTKRTPSGGPATTFRYDQAHRLIAVERSTPTIAESFSYDGLGLLATRTVSGTAHRLVWDPTESPQALLTDGEYSYIYGPGGLPIEQISSGEVPTYLHHDQLGSTRLITNATGEVGGTFTYGPYGGTTGSTGTASTALGYAGQYTMGQSGLQYLRARFYDPVTAQFLTVDPLVDLTREPYAYASNDPVDMVDPSGEDLLDDVAGVIDGGCAVTAEIPGVDAATCGAAVVVTGGAALATVIEASNEDESASVLQSSSEVDEFDEDNSAAEKDIDCDIPGSPYEGANAPDAWWERQGQPRGISRGQVRERLHDIKRGAGLGATDDVTIGKTGDVYDPRTGERIGSLTQPVQ